MKKHDTYLPSNHKKNTPPAIDTSKKENTTAASFQDKRPEAVRVHQLQQMANDSVMSGGTIQRIRIKLKDEDHALMAELRQTVVPNPGGQAVDNPAAAAHAAPIGVNENIILEGHGYEGFFTSKVVSQGGIDPDRLAQIAHSVPKPPLWTGKIILLGCKTGDITSKVSKEYFKIAKTQVEVIGTNTNIKVGAKADGSRFAGAEWSHFPVGQRPNDLEFVTELFDISGDFLNTALDFVDLIIELENYRQKKGAGITKNLQTIEQQGHRLITIDATSTATKIPHKNYKLAERQHLYTFFDNVAKAIRAISFFQYPNQVKPITGNPAEKIEVNHAAVENGKLTNAVAPGVRELQAYYRGLKLKEVDFGSKVGTTHSKMERTKESFFGDTWEERA
ncbi:hypothetical protein [Ascidiimonas sp. W6]|uniref:hypothetical protein n=1 Tax=Ascidiimonas meishanensis TaxID=3128903 RepID=UPI0030EE40F5